ncbi:hypothetical protein MD484_g3859, partial [Candolleomyces efflorescens]
MRLSQIFGLNSATALFLAASQLVSAAGADVNWETYLEGYKHNLQNFGVYDTRRIIAKPGPGLSKSRPVVDVDGKTIPDYDVLYEFDQLIDHNDASRGTFKMSSALFNVPLLNNYLRAGGELFMTNATLPGAIAQATNGAVVLVEHRFYGKSQPFSDLSVDSLRFHTIAQALQDFVYFAQNAKLAMPGGDSERIRPNRSPWIFMGGSYSGGLAAYIMEQHPGVFWASYSSSGALQPKIDFWQYWSPIEQYLPANCTADIKAVVSLIDGVIDSGNQTRMTEIQTQFGLGSLRTIDFLNTMNVPLRTWQTLQPASSRNSLIYPFCDALETEGAQVAGAEGWGAEIALPKFSDIFRNIITSLCGGTTPQALERCQSRLPIGFNGTRYASTEIDDNQRPWMWTLCNELGWFQPGPANGGGIVSKHFSVQAWTNFCTEAFPGAFTNSTTEFRARVNTTLQQYKGWNTMADRVFVVNGRPSI